MTTPAPAAPESTRLSKRVAKLFECSRSIAQIYIEGGWVQVDGVVVEEPQFKVADQVIVLDPDAQTTPLRSMTMIAHKPAELALDALIDSRQPWFQSTNRSSLDHSRQRLLKAHGRNLQVALPLDAAACGLVVVTQDSSVLRKLAQTHPGPEQEYLVELTAEPDASALNRLRLSDDSGPHRKQTLKVSLQSEARLRLVGKALDCELIHELCERAGLPIHSIKRIRIGSVSMAKIAIGQWRYLMESERF